MAAKPATTTRRSTRTQAVSYRETSSSDASPSSDEEEDETDFIVAAEPPTKKRRLSGPQRGTRAKQGSAAATYSLAAPRKHVISPAKKAPNALKTMSHTIPTDNIIPDWASLPYEVLLSIFRFASTPLRDEPLLRPKPSVNWLLTTAKMCRAFKEPALAALYESPPLFELAGPHGLLALLKSNPSEQSMAYATKIRRLEIDANRTLVYTAPGMGLIDVVDLLSHMPQLSEVEILDGADRPPYRLLHRGKTWTYPDMFDALSANSVRLSKWHWNAHMVKQLSVGEGFSDGVADMLNHAHSAPALHQLKHLSMSQFEPTSGPRGSRRKSDANEEPTILADRVRRVVAPLKSLQSISLVFCSAFERAWSEVLQALPSNLQSLTISNTQFLHSGSLREFLSSHGRQLRELVLDHNQSLDLGFAVDLAQTCPHLESLHMDMTFYNHIVSYEDNKPLFDTLLSPGEVPTWPKSLRSLELYNLRQWSSDIAENFFKSLIDSAPGLPDLRYLIIKAILNIGWRDRAGFRDTWISRLQAVFHRQSVNPDPSLASKRAFLESRQGIASDAAILQTDAVHAGGSPAAHADGLADLSLEPVMGNRARRSQRIRTKEVERVDHAESPPSDASLEDVPRSGWKLPTNPVIQGLCEVVDINIDNNRPGEVQFREGDFLDSDPGEDEEYLED